jgi:hypothetical protein
LDEYGKPVLSKKDTILCVVNFNINRIKLLLNNTLKAVTMLGIWMFCDDSGFLWEQYKQFAPSLYQDIADRECVSYGPVL